MNEGEDKLPEVLDLARHLVTMADEKPKEVEDHISICLDNMKEIGMCVITLACGWGPGEMQGLAPVEAVMSATAGAYVLTKSAIKQSPFWKKKEVECRRYDIGNRTLGPAIDKNLASIKEGCWEAVQTSIDQLPKWQDSTSPGRTSALESSLEETCRARLAQLQKNGDAEGLAEFALVLDKASEKIPMLSSSCKTLASRARDSEGQVKAEQMRVETERVITTFQSEDDLPASTAA